MTPKLLQLITGNVPNLPGWCTVEKACDLADVILRLKAEKTVEIGVFGARSLIPMAMAHAEQDRGIIIGIDAWDAAASVEGETKENAEWWGKVDHEAIYQGAVNHIKQLGLEKYVQLIRARSDDVEVPDVIDVLHVDGSHTAQAIKDVDRFAPRVRPGGIVFLDDIHWAGGGVEQAMAHLLSLGFRHLSSRDTGAFFERIPAVAAVPAEPPAPPAGAPEQPKRTRKPRAPAKKKH